MKLLLAILALGTVGSLQALERVGHALPFEGTRTFQFDSFRPYSTGMGSEASSYARGGVYKATTTQFPSATPRIEAIHLDQAP